MTHRQMVEAWGKDQEFKTAYDELGAEFALLLKHSRPIDLPASRKQSRRRQREHAISSDKNTSKCKFLLV